MKKVSPNKRAQELRPEYDMSLLQGGMRGKYYSRANEGSNLVLIEPDLAKLFPDGRAVNKALHVIAEAAQAAAISKARRKRIG